MTETLIEILTRERHGETHKISWWAKWMFVRLHQRAQRAGREVPVEDMEVYLASQPATQFECAAASEAYSLVKHLPFKHREVMLLLIDGANPLEISDEVNIPITEVLFVIRQAREWLADGAIYLSREYSSLSAPNIVELDSRAEPHRDTPEQRSYQDQPWLFRPIVKRRR